MYLKLQTASAEDSATLEVSDAVFGVEYNQALIHQVITAYMAGARSGTKAQKNRSQTSGGGSKPWRQKGTGRARAGTIRSPIWRSGGVTFAAKPRDYSQKVNRKMYRGALRSILSELVRQERLVALHEFSVETPKTKDLISKLKDLGLKEVLILTELSDKNLYLAARNIRNVNVADINALDPVSLVCYDKVLVTSSAVKKIEERLA